MSEERSEWVDPLSGEVIGGTVEQRLRALEQEVRELRRRLDERDNREWTEIVERSEWPIDD